MVRMTINDKIIEAPEGSTILEAARRNHIFIPSLCHMNAQKPSGSCRICVVEVEGEKHLQASCIARVREDMVIQTNTQRVRSARKVLYELILSDHDHSCLTCNRNMSCELQELGKKLDLDEPRFDGDLSPDHVDMSVAITQDKGKCILCRRCVDACNKLQTAGILHVQDRGFGATVAPADGQPLGDGACIFCGQCTVVCPVGALKETDSIRSVWDALNDPDMRVVALVEPAVRVAIGEEFGIPLGTDVTGKLASAIKELRFDDVFDSEWGADLTVMEEATALLGRLKSYTEGRRTQLPMVSSVSAGFVKYAEHHYPDHLAHLSSCKSPHMMMGALIKEHYARKLGIKAGQLFVVTITSCTAKKFEAKRPELTNGGLQNVDAVLTTRELADMIRAVGIDFDLMEWSRFHNPFGHASAATDSFGVVSGILPSTLATAYAMVTGRNLPQEELLSGGEVEEGEITFIDPLPEYARLDGFTLRYAAASGTRGADALMQGVADGTSPYHYMEVMGCPGGCVMGGGQPRSYDETACEKRLAAIRLADEDDPVRRAHENPAVRELYAEYLGKPGDARSHDLLHTAYVRRGAFNELSDERFTVPYEKREKTTPVTPAKAPEAAQHSREDNARLMALEAENARLRTDLSEAQNTMEVFRKIIVDRTGK